MTVYTSIVRYVTDDGYNLYAAWYEAQAAQTAFLMIHGFCSNFYRTPLRDVAEYLAPLGYACLVTNTRGRDRMGNTEGPQPAEGSYVERLSESVQDINAGLAWLRERGYTRVVLAGHSLGGMKSIQYAAHHPTEQVQGLVSVSCPLQVGVPPQLELAQQMQREGREYELIYDNEQNPLGTPVMILDRQESIETYNPPANARRITIPAFYLAGEAESQSFRLAAEACARAAGDYATLRTMPGADHVYTDCELDLARAIESWLKKVEL